MSQGCLHSYFGRRRQMVWETSKGDHFCPVIVLEQLANCQVLAMLSPSVSPLDPCDFNDSHDTQGISDPVSHTLAYVTSTTPIIMSMAASCNHKLFIQHTIAFVFRWPVHVTPYAESNILKVCSWRRSHTLLNKKSDYYCLYNNMGTRLLAC